LLGKEDLNFLTSSWNNLLASNEVFEVKLENSLRSS